MRGRLGTIPRVDTLVDRSIDTYLAHWAPRVDATLDELLPDDTERPSELHQAMRYSVLGGGKRVRPVLALLGARASGAREEDHLGVASALELVHTYSLIHDDLPCMDDDDFRRGRPSCHKQFGEALAVLAGDALNTLAFEVVIEHAVTPERAARAALVLAQATGTAGMVGGQVVDLLSERLPPERERVQWIHERKTGALLAASVRMGAISAGAPPELESRLTDYGVRIGLAFQIVDDLLDEEGDAAQLGKTPGKDREQGKQTYPAAFGVEAARAEAARLLDEAAGIVDGLPGEALLVGLCDYLNRRRA